jgi:hypothetical protein
VYVADEIKHQQNDYKRKQTSSSSGIDAARGKPSPTLAIHVMNNIVSEFMKICQRLDTTQSHSAHPPSFVFLQLPVSFDSRAIATTLTLEIIITWLFERCQFSVNTL